MSIEVFPLPPSGPSLAEITSAITTNAAPATVTMPAITSSITTNAASSGVTMAAITTAIQNNSATVSSGNTAGWRRTSPGGLTLVASGNWSSLTSTNTVTISGLSGYSFYRLFIIGYYNATQLCMRINGNSDPRYDMYTKLGAGSELQRRSTFWRINVSNGVEYNQTTMDIQDADSANYKFAYGSGTTRGSGFETPYFVWSKAEALSSITLFTENSNNFTSAGYDGQGYYLYGGY